MIGNGEMLSSLEIETCDQATVSSPALVYSFAFIYRVASPSLSHSQFDANTLVMVITASHYLFLVVWE